MKNFSKLLLILLITVVYTNVYSQDENNPWQFTFGVHAVDLDADTNTSITFSGSDVFNMATGGTTALTLDA